ncbi:MAG: glycosyltransferase family 2 protein [Candidatus Tectimicrobiota bacterium]
MKLSLYTFVKDGLYFDFHIVDMLKHHVPLADEIIVNEGLSTDGTYEAIKDIDPKIRIIQTEWDRSDPKTWRLKYVTQTRELCTGDWCVMIDADEFIPEWEFQRLREFCETTDKHIAKFRFIHFYGNYKVHCRPEKRPILPAVGNRVHRNLPNIEVWGDASTVRLRGGSDDQREFSNEEFLCHHFSAVRNPARLRHKWRIQKLRNVDNKWSRMPSFLFNFFPHDWLDEDFIKDLEIYEGPYIKAVLDNPSEFVRDEFKLYNFLANEKRQ